MAGLWTSGSLNSWTSDSATSESLQGKLSSAKWDFWNSGPQIPDANEFPILEPLNLGAGIPVLHESLEPSNDQIPNTRFSLFCPNREIPSYSDL